MLTELRTGIATTLEAVGIRSVEYTSEALRPPVAAVVPGEPYLSWGENTQAAAFAYPMRVRFDVLLLIAQTGSKSEAKAIDDLIEKAVTVLADEHHISRVTQPGVLSLERRGKSVEYVGAVIQLEHDTNEPEG